MCAFAVLLASRIPMVQQFGAIVAFELAAAGVASIALLPACAALLDEMRSRPMAIEYPGPRVIEAGP
jgi:predicted RND superfamily exporter protein